MGKEFHLDNRRHITRINFNGVVTEMMEVAYFIVNDKFYYVMTV